MISGHFLRSHPLQTIMKAVFILLLKLKDMLIDELLRQLRRGKELCLTQGTLLYELQANFIPLEACDEESSEGIFLTHSTGVLTRGCLACVSHVTRTYSLYVSLLLAYLHDKSAGIESLGSLPNEHVFVCTCHRSSH